ncbi:ribose ABC transporter substrate-binding protein [Patulibacter medicamentivorans]|uniref:Ribose ABC transporter substrate-binding protein n=2 Tax=Patulibacter medicamentivorans TaxID=1097667 RepID=H0E719_9ACTN|nr:ribose ABC transporter substrate-binding protein [Patulibacter medicamentivorans]
MGNEWRPQMVNVAKFVAGSADYRDKVKLDVRISDATPAAQIQSLQSVIRKKPDAIMIDAASATALNPTLEQACKAGILVFSFDQVVTAPCAYKLPQDYEAQATDAVNWLGTQLKGKGKILMDTGLPGIPLSETYVKVWKKVLAEKYPGIEVVGTFSSQYAPGPELQGVSAQLARNPKIDGILSGAYVASDIKALKQAGRPMVPMTGLDFNGGQKQCATEKLKCFFIGAPAFVSGMAIERIVKVLDGGQQPKQEVYFDTNYVSEAGQIDFPHTQKLETLKAGENYYPDGADSLVTPISFGAHDITAADVLGK